MRETMELYVPNRTCPCLRCKCSELMAPALFVCTGLLLLVSNLGGSGFGRTWPLLLIVTGAVRVLQSTASTAGHRDEAVPVPVVEPAHE
jgi:hypothetical protein